MNYLSWHFIHVPRRLLSIWRNFFIFFYHYFSIPLLLKTLLAPWKKIYHAKKASGFSPNEFFERISFNLISRVVGLIMRLFTIGVGVGFEFLTLCVGALLILFWLCTPLLTYPIFLTEQARTRAKEIPMYAQNAQQFVEQFLNSPMGRFVCTRLMLDPKELISRIDPNLPPPKAGMVSAWFFSENPVKEGFTLRNPEYSKGDEGFVIKSDSLRQFFFDHNINQEDFQNVLDWFNREQEDQSKGAFWELDTLLRIPSIGKHWTYGFTPTIDQLTTDLSLETIPFGKFIGRTAETESIEKILSKASQSNVCVIGENGVGKHSIVIHLADLVDQGRVYPHIEFKRILKLNLEQVLGAGIDLTQRKGVLATLFEEAQAAGNIVFVIDEFDRFVSTREDRIDLTDVFVHELNSNRLQIIALTTPGAFEQYIRPNKTITELFETVEIKEPNSAETLIILTSVVGHFEREGIFFPYQSLKKVVELADRFIKDTTFPEKAINILDLVTTAKKSIQAGGASRGAPSPGSPFVGGAGAGERQDPRNLLSQNPIVTPQEIEAIVSEQIKTPISLSTTEKTLLLSLENKLHERVIDQNEAITAVSNALRRARTDVSARKNKPYGSFLFLGPTGVGKTETAKALTQVFFGNEKRMLRFDMSEFQETEATVRFLGDFKTGKEGVFTSSLRENPYSLVLLDEFEKANKNLLNLFLAALDEGFVTDAFGKKVYLTSTIIIATSNAGSEFIREHALTGGPSEKLKAGLSADQPPFAPSTNSSEEAQSKVRRDPPPSDGLKTQLIEHVQRERIFSPELLNRFDEVIVFQPLTRQNAAQILELLLTQLNQKSQKDQGITIGLSEATREKILSEGFSVSFGARELARSVARLVEDPLSQKILKGEIRRGERISI